ncbi:hypothetical protein [Lacticaseibacillus nasuensis]|uniref:hypothetical protein n=1 Tax=Lacticaseibacillus nasuensis TaxID=944671 RepID=UPI0022485D8E|nr:hypothetical protein [Lacticaseibacillus nasuensis]MCX2455954.1 hypothetical protein [Lacticaseibacillus nasuensis]
MKKLLIILASLLIGLSLTGCVSKQASSRAAKWVTRDSRLLFGVAPSRVVVARLPISETGHYRELTLTYTKAAQAKLPKPARHALNQAGQLTLQYADSSTKGKLRAHRLTAMGLALLSALDLAGGLHALAQEPQLWRLWVRPNPQIVAADQWVQDFCIDNVADVKRAVRQRAALANGSAAVRRSFVANLQAPPHFSLQATYRFAYTTDAALTKFLRPLILTQHLPAGTTITLDEAHGPHATSFTYQAGQLTCDGTGQVLGGH